MSVCVSHFVVHRAGFPIRSQLKINPDFYPKMSNVNVNNLSMEIKSVYEDDKTGHGWSNIFK